MWSTNKPYKKNGEWQKNEKRKLNTRPINVSQAYQSEFISPATSVADPEKESRLLEVGNKNTRRKTGVKKQGMYNGGEKRAKTNKKNTRHAAASVFTLCRPWQGSRGGRFAGVSPLMHVQRPPGGRIGYVGSIGGYTGKVIENLLSRLWKQRLAAPAAATPANSTGPFSEGASWNSQWIRNIPFSFLFAFLLFAEQIKRRFSFYEGLSFVEW